MQCVSTFAHNRTRRETEKRNKDNPSPSWIGSLMVPGSPPKPARGKAPLSACFLLPSPRGRKRAVPCLVARDGGKIPIEGCAVRQSTTQSAKIRARPPNWIHPHRISYCLRIRYSTPSSRTSPHLAAGIPLLLRLQLPWQCSHRQAESPQRDKRASAEEPAPSDRKKGRSRRKKKHGSLSRSVQLEATKQPPSATYRCTKRDAVCFGLPNRIRGTVACCATNRRSLPSLRMTSLGSVSCLHGPLPRNIEQAVCWSRKPCC